ncbi:MAG TPA: hypothetical protein PLH39_11855, partial [Promineifilum sp.]|nr:hypothetical protein [Promineifilum sp.]
EGLSFGGYALQPHLALAVFAAAAAGDGVAAGILRWAGEELGWLAVAVLRQLDLQGEAVEVVQSGSVFDGGAAITAPMEAVVRLHAPRARFIRLRTLPVIGAVTLAVATGGRSPYPLRDALIATLPDVYPPAAG